MKPLQQFIRQHVDLIAGCGALSWAIAAVFLPELSSLVDSKAAGAFALLALGRWVTTMRSAPKTDQVLLPSGEYDR